MHCYKLFSKRSVSQSANEVLSGAGYLGASGYKMFSRRLTSTARRGFHLLENTSRARTNLIRASTSVIRFNNAATHCGSKIDKNIDQWTRENLRFPLYRPLFSSRISFPHNSDDLLFFGFTQKAGCFQISIRCLSLSSRCLADQHEKSRVEKTLELLRQELEEEQKKLAAANTNQVKLVPVDDTDESKAVAKRKSRLCGSGSKRNCSIITTGSDSFGSISRSPSDWFGRSLKGST